MRWADDMLGGNDDVLQVDRAYDRDVMRAKLAE